VIEGLSLAVGVAVIKALESVGIQGLQVKWPNDILHHGHKLAGVLIEMTGEVGSACHVVIGVGVNLRLSDSIKKQILQPVTDLYTISGLLIDRQKVTAAIVTALITLLMSYDQTGFAKWHDEWLKYDAFKNEIVDILGLQEPIHGVAKGVDERGNLLVETEKGLMRIFGGEVSLRQAMSA
jgi:BirA family biotin operon repressor/biotin-[acetyl-CoA-carboxylase] ligase